MSMDYSTVTEVTGNRLTREALAMMYTRYRFASQRCQGKTVLEAGCGVGQGMGLVGRTARRVVGGDFTHRLLRLARDQYGDRFPLLSLDAQRFPFSDESFDALLFYEAVYYLPDPHRFLREGNRILRRGGTVLICSVNPAWSGFQPSPHSVGYFTPKELGRRMEDAGFRTELFGAYATRDVSLRGRTVAAIRSAAVSLHLMPKTMKGKEKLKRLFYGKLVESPAELADDSVIAEDPVLLTGREPEDAYKVTFAVGTKP